MLYLNAQENIFRGAMEGRSACDNKSKQLWKASYDY